MKKVLLTILSSIAIANILTACNSGSNPGTNSTTPPHVTDNKVLTDQVCNQMAAGYASKRYNIKDPKGNLHKSIETCSNWYSYRAKQQTQKMVNSSIGLQGSSPSAPYFTDSNTVLNWGQADGNQLLWAAIGMGQVDDWAMYDGLTLQGTGKNNASQFINSSGMLQTPRICADDAQYNVSGTVLLTITPGYHVTNFTPEFEYAVTYINYCSQQGTTAGNYNHYSNVINIFGGITMDQLFTSGTNFNNCTNNTTNPGANNSSSTMTCYFESANLVIQPSETTPAVPPTDNSNTWWFYATWNQN